MAWVAAFSLEAPHSPTFVFESSQRWLPRSQLEIDFKKSNRRIQEQNTAYMEHPWVMHSECIKCAQKTRHLRRTCAMRGQLRVSKYLSQDLQFFGFYWVLFAAKWVPSRFVCGSICGPGASVKNRRLGLSPNNEDSMDSKGLEER